MEELDKKVKQVNLVKSVAHFYEENRLATQSTPLTRVELRVVRVFVSSTFRDMVEERDELLTV